MKTLAKYIFPILLCYIMCSFQIQKDPETDIGKSLQTILTENETDQTLIGHSDSTLKYINEDTEIITKYYLTKQEICYKVELYYQRVSMEQIGRRYILADWTDTKLYHFEKGNYKMELTERSSNYPVATITKKDLP